MSQIDSAIIDFTEAAYDLALGDEEWLPTLIERGLPVLDHGLGVACMEYARPPDGGPVEIRRVHVGSGPEDFPERHLAALQTTPPDTLREQVRPGGVGTVSDNAPDGDRAELDHYLSYVDYAKDLFYITAVDCRGDGVAIVAPLPEITSLSPQESQRWQMLAAHVEAGHRLRQGLATRDCDDAPRTALPYDAEAIFDANSFRISDAVGAAKERSATKRLREAAIAVDKARGLLRRSEPEVALETWKALVDGRWSTVDWFDTDSRRFIVAIPNPPQVVDPRGLTERERQVVTYAAYGQTNKMIGYRLGLSRSRVSMLLRSAMRKMGLKTRAQLVQRVREVGLID